MGDESGSLTATGLKKSTKSFWALCALVNAVDFALGITYVRQLESLKFETISEFVFTCSAIMKIVRSVEVGALASCTFRQREHQPQSNVTDIPVLMLADYGLEGEGFNSSDIILARRLVSVQVGIAWVLIMLMITIHAIEEQTHGFEIWFPVLIFAAVFLFLFVIFPFLFEEGGGEGSCPTSFIARVCGMLRIVSGPVAVNIAEVVVVINAGDWGFERIILVIADIGVPVPALVTIISLLVSTIKS